ncbi:MAG TPA: TIM barrel protein [Terracidiphilus sp.]|nr:TIM barrel protein [Terracidiphilus sp.]
MTIASRREFLKAAGAAAVVAGSGRAEARTLKVPVGLELYSVREMLPKDFQGTLNQVHSAGYAVVEAAGFYNRSATDFRKAMDQAGLRCISAHYTLMLLNQQLDSIISYAKDLGLEYIICSSSDGMHRDPNAHGVPTLDDWHWRIDQFNRIGATVKSAGMTFGIHNHTPEFATIDGVLVYDEIMKRTDPKYVTLQMDCGWVYLSSHSPAEFIARDPSRFQLLHVKDMIRVPGSDEPEMPVMGKGNIDYKPILRAATHLKYYFVEQERFDGDPWVELRADADYMKNFNF